MDARLKKLEQEMTRSREIRKKTELLREKQENWTDQPHGRKEKEDFPQKNKRFSRNVIREEDLVREDPVREETVQTFRSSWAKEVGRTQCYQKDGYGRRQESREWSEKGNTGARKKR